MRKPMAIAALAGLPLLLSGCILIQLVLLPLKLLFGAAQSVGGAVADARVEPLEGPPPTLTPMPDGRWLVEAPSEPARFRVTLTVAGDRSESWVWPDDFRGVSAGPDGIAEVPSRLAAR